MRLSGEIGSDEEGDEAGDGGEVGSEAGEGGCGEVEEGEGEFGVGAGTVEDAAEEGGGEGEVAG